MGESASTTKITYLRTKLAVFSYPKKQTVFLALAKHAFSFRFLARFSLPFVFLLAHVKWEKFSRVSRILGEEEDGLCFRRVKFF